MCQRVVIAIFASIFSISVLFPAATTASPTSSRNSSADLGPHRVYRILPNNTEQLDILFGLWKTASKYQLNFWKEPSRVGSAVDVMAPAKTQKRFEDRLREGGLDYVVTIKDVKKLIEDRERGPVSEFDRMMRDDASDDGLFYDFDRYYSYEHMRLYMREIERRFPDMAKVYTIGFTHERRPIEMIKIGYPLTKQGKKSIWIDGGIHAREWPASTTAIYFMQQLASRYNKDPEITQFVQDLNWYIVPMLNPDGFEYSRSSSDPDIRLWRKNRAPNAGCRRERACCMGVDLNRNFDFHWGETGSSTDPCDEIYQGTSPFSEPEAQAVRDFITNHKEDIEAMITMHTYSQLWLHSYGHIRNSYPPDVDELRSLGERAVSALRQVSGTVFKVGSGADTLYPASGGSDDWSKSKAGIKYVYLLELRPEDGVVDGFIVPTNQILPTARETWEGVKVVANEVLKRADDSKGQTPFNARRTNKRT